MRKRFEWGAMRITTSLLLLNNPTLRIVADGVTESIHDGAIAHGGDGPSGSYLIATVKLGDNS
jgi:hypothetical protein